MIRSDIKPLSAAVERGTPLFQKEAALMRAIIFDPSARHQFRFDEVPEPEPVTPDQLLIEVRAISLNFGEVYSGDNVESPGDIPGWDSAGVVAQAAADGSGPPVGTRVAGAGWSQAWAQRRLLTSNNVATIPDSVDFETAAAMGVAGVTSLQVVRRLGSIVGRRVLITGASGGVGRLAVQLAAKAGAHVVATVGNRQRGAGLLELGAAEVVVGLEGVAPVHGVLEHVGGKMLADAFALLADGGRVVSIGATSGEPTTIDFEAARMTLLRKRIEPFMTAWPIGADLQYVLEMVDRGELDPQVGYRDSWENVDTAIDALLGRRVAGKVALTVSPSRS